ncbi:MAG: hypothetical protein FWF29_05715 [Treponema sp.]|nr:hypothetical protein [Treponema sp.]
MDYFEANDYNYYMIVNIEVIRPEALNLLRDLESLGLIHVQPEATLDNAETVKENTPPYQKLRGIHKNIQGASVNNFFARCHEDKKYELAKDKQREKERACHANAKFSS